MKGHLTLLAFTLDQVLYAIDIHEVQEVVLLPELTPFVDGPSFVSGIFNLRGHLVTAIDLRRRLGLRCPQWDVKNAVLIIRTGEKAYGLIVDEALSLVTVPDSDVESAPELSTTGQSLEGKFVLAIGKLNGQLIPILNLNRIITSGDALQISDWPVKARHD